MLQPILLKIIIHLISGIHAFQIHKRRHASRIVGCESGASKSLAQNFVAESLAGGVEGGVEDAALHFEEVEDAGAGDERHCEIRDSGETLYWGDGRWW